MIVHRNTFIYENNHQQMKEIQDSCTTCLIKLFKIFKVIILFIIYDYSFKMVEDINLLKSKQVEKF